MKKNLHLLITLCILSINAFAQNENKSIVDELNSSKWGEGKVTVMQDDALKGVLGLRQESDTTSIAGLGVIEPNAEYEKVRGFKIQVYSGNKQQVSRKEAEARQVKIREAFPDLEADVNFHSPFWRLRVGNFLMRNDAEIVLLEMKEALPSLAKEMYVVVDEVKKPLNQ